MKMQFKIKNLKQLKAISDLCLSGSSTSKKFFDKKIKLTFNLLEVLDNRPVSISKPSSSNPELLDFVNDSDEVLFSYVVGTDEIIQYGEDYEVFEISDDCSSDTKDTSGNENSERAFLYLLNFNLENGYWLESVSQCKKTRPDIRLAVFGY